METPQFFISCFPAAGQPWGLFLPPASLCEGHGAMVASLTFVSVAQDKRGWKEDNWWGSTLETDMMGKGA